MINGCEAIVESSHADTMPFCSKWAIEIIVIPFAAHSVQKWILCIGAPYRDDRPSTLSYSGFSFEIFFSWFLLHVLDSTKSHVNICTTFKIHFNWNSSHPMGLTDSLNSNLCKKIIRKKQSFNMAFRINGQFHSKDIKFTGKIFSSCFWWTLPEAMRRNDAIHWDVRWVEPVRNL